MDLLSMSGYAAFVWSSFFIVIGALFTLHVFAKWRLNKVLAEERQLKEDDQ